MQSPSRFWCTLGLGALAASLAAASCSDDTSSGSSSSSGGGDSTSGTGGEGGSTGSFTGGSGGSCAGGEPCEGGVCVDGSCCPTAQLCGDQCCGGAEVCAFLQCVTPGVTCTDDKECGADEYCDLGLGGGEGGAGGAMGMGGGGGGTEQCVGGVVVPDGKCMPKPPVCPGQTEPGDPATCVTECKYYPPVGNFSPVLKYAWGDPAAPSTRDSVMMAPVVVQLDDDDCNGVVDERDIPEIVFSTFLTNQYNANGTLHAISIVEGQVVEKWSFNAGATSPIHPGRSIAAGNIDGVPGNEIVACTTDGRVRAFRANGTELWTSGTGTACFMPSIADLDQDGMPEIVVDGAILNGEDGSFQVAAYSPPNTANVLAYDIDGDGMLDVVTPTRAYKADGTLLVDTGLAASYHAVGDLDLDGVPEIVAVNRPTHTLSIWRHDANAAGGFVIVRQGIDINGDLDPNLCPAGSAGNTQGGGPPTVADFDGDGTPDVALAGGVGYAVFDGSLLMDANVANAATLMWIRQTQDCSSAATGSSVFDFEGDGIAEVVYADETTFHVYAGPDGAELFQTCNTNGTLFEYPLVADVDNDGQADIVVVSNSYSGFNCAGVKTAGVRIFGDANNDWVRTRRVWNQHGYHVTNVGEDGSIPAIEPSNHLTTGLNNFRQNVQPSGQFSAPDLVVSLRPACAGEYGLVARVLNLGEAPVPAGIGVEFFSNAQGGVSLGTGATSKALYPLGYEDVFLPLASVPMGQVHALVSDGSGTPSFRECRTDNNESAKVSPECTIPQ